MTIDLVEKGQTMDPRTLTASLGYHPAQGWIGSGVVLVLFVAVCVSAELLYRRDKRNTLRRAEVRRRPQ